MDGGLTALGGFLYQTVGALGLKADAFQEYHDSPTNKGDLEMLLGFAKDGEIRYEDQDQDVSIRDVFHGELPGYILIQFKYCSQSPHRPITKYDMNNIVSRLQASQEKALNCGQHVTGYSLLTNRPLNSDAQKIADAYHLPFYVTSSLPERYWEEGLRQFACRFGCSDTEIDAGIRKGIGDLALKATNPRYYGEPVITKEMLIEIFTGCQTAHAVTPEIIVKESQRHLTTLFTQSFHLGAQPLLLRQTIHKQLSDLVEQHAFVVLSGVGGNGKTAVLWQWMDDCFTSELPQRLGRYYSLSPSRLVQKDFLAHLFCAWTHVPTSHPWYSLQQPEQILDRLEIARRASMKDSSGGHPIFVLGLDAVDEAFQEPDRRALRRLLIWFWEQEAQLHQKPLATLIITCRDSKELADRWLNITSPYGNEPMPFRDVEVIVDEFSPSELVAVARLHLPTLAERFEQTYRALEVKYTPIASSQTVSTGEMKYTSNIQTFEMDAAGMVLQPESPSLQAVDAEVFKALCHPALWNCLLTIDGTIQSRILDGETGALEQLATRFLYWFCHKVRARGNRVYDEDMLAVLKKIAHHCDTRQSPRSKRKDWITHTSKTSYMNREQAESFFQEALSAGLILPDTGGWWRWRHPFIGEYLALQPLSEEDEE